RASGVHTVARTTPRLKVSTSRRDEGGTFRRMTKASTFPTSSPPTSDRSKPPNSADNLTVGPSARMARAPGLVRAALSQLGYPPVRPSLHGRASACGRAGGAYPYHRKYPYGEKR